MCIAAENAEQILLCMAAIKQRTDLIGVEVGRAEGQPACLQSAGRVLRDSCSPLMLRYCVKGLLPFVSLFSCSCLEVPWYVFKRSAMGAL